MPIEYAIDHHNHFVEARLRDPVSDEDLVAVVEAIRAEIPAGGGYVALTIVGDVDLSALTSRGIHLASTLFSPNTPLARNAIVAADDLGFGLARMFGATASSTDFEVQVFRTEDDARAWLGK